MKKIPNDSPAADRRCDDSQRPRGLPDQRRVALLLQIGENLRQRPPRNPAPQLEHRSAGPGLLARNHGQLPERHVYPRRMGLETPFREILRRTVGRRPLRQRLSRRHAPRRRHGLHVRNHRQNPFRKRQLDARGGQQQQPQRRAAHLDRHEPLRRHLPRGGTDPHRAHGRFAALPRVGRCARTPADGRPRKGRGAKSRSTSPRRGTTAAR